MANEVFISYSRKDYEKVRKIKEEIDRTIGINCWMDLDGIESDKQFVDVIINAINRHETILFILSKSSMYSTWALKELRFAEDKKKRIVLVLIDNSKMTDKFSFHYGDKDVIDWNAILERNKLLSNLKTWHPTTIQAPSFDFNHKDDNVSKSSIVKKPKHILFSICIFITLIVIGGLSYAFLHDTPKELFEKGLSYHQEGNYVEAVKYFRKAAEQNYAEAQCYMGQYYFNGTELPKIKEDAFKWWQKAAEQGDMCAQYFLGYCYLEGEGIEDEDEDEAAKWFRKSAEQGYAPAQLKLGDCYEDGDGVPEDEDKAVEWWLKAAEQGNAEAQYNLGDYYDGENSEKAFEWYKKSADQGYADAQLNLGYCYRNGDGVSEDQSKAIEWFMKAAEQGESYAQLNIGYYYYEGKYVHQDGEEAVKWFRKSADQDNYISLTMLGLCYDKGFGVPLDKRMAFDYFKRAAEKGYPIAQYNLALYYYNGYGVSQNREEAVIWYKKAAVQKDKDAQNALKEMGETW